MKKFKIILFILLSSVLFIGCNNIAVNEIYNKSYNVGEINLEDFENIIVASIEKATPAVIGVSNYQDTLIGSDKLVGTGSGVVYKCSALMKDGTTTNDCSTTIDSNSVEKYNYYAITNRHVIEDSEKVMIYLGQEDIKLDGELIQYDDKVDLAVIRFSHYKYIQPLEFADSDQLKSGNFAVAIGNPSGYDFWGSATFGIVSFPKRYLSDDTDNDGTTDWDAEYIQHDVAINPGNSGGALINIKGELIGINTLKILSNEIDNMGFAIPSNVVKELVQILETGAMPKRNTLGISVIPVKTILNPDDYGNEVDDYIVPEGLDYGLYVTTVETGRPAYNILLPGDIIVNLNGVDIYYSHEFRAEINKILKGETGEFTIYRNNKVIVVSITF